MLIEEFLYAFLSSIGGVWGDRISPNILGQDVQFPAMRYSVVSDLSDNILSGTSNVRKIRFQIDVYSPVYKQTIIGANQLRNAVRNSDAFLQNYLGVQGMQVNNRLSFYEAVSNLHRSSTDITVHYQDNIQLGDE